MNEPSPEAKEAAEKAVDYASDFARMKEFGYRDHVKAIAVFVEQAIDAATAKWKQAAETVRDVATEQMDEKDATIAKLREELAEAAGWKDAFWDAMKRLIELKKQLAHQQPSISDIARERGWQPHPDSPVAHLHKKKPS